MKASIHVIHETKGMLTKATLEHVPRVGDELRLTGERYFKVTLVVWVLDEPDHPYQRVNIGVVDSAYALLAASGKEQMK